MNSCGKDGCQNFKVRENRLGKAGGSKRKTQHLEYFEAKISIRISSIFVNFQTIREGMTNQDF